MSEGKEKNHPLFTCSRLFAEIRGYAQYAVSHRNDPESLQKALSAIERISHQGGDLARYLVATVLGKAPKGRECSLCEVADDFVHHAQTAQPSPDIHLTRAFNADPVVLVEPSWLHHALRAALLHILRFFRPGEKVTATVKVDEQGAWARICVYANAVGNEGTFEGRGEQSGEEAPWYEVQAVQKIMELLGGTVTCANSGDTRAMTISLPKMVRTGPLSADDVRPATAGRRPDAGISILLADDEGGIRDLLKAILTSAGVTSIETAANGAEACQRAAQREYSAIIMDVSMPVLSGIEAFKKIKSARLSARIIFITGLYEEGEIAGMVSGESAYGFIKKPFNISEIRSPIERISAEVA